MFQVRLSHLIGRATSGVAERRPPKVCCWLSMFYGLHCVSPTYQVYTVTSVSIDMQSMYGINIP